jgi:hypothetical protein
MTAVDTSNTNSSFTPHMTFNTRSPRIWQPAKVQQRHARVLSESVHLSAQTGASAATLIPATPLSLAHATQTTNVPSWDAALIDTGSGPVGNGAFNKTNPWIRSSDVLRMSFALNPASHKKASPTLVQWQIEYACVWAE